MHGKVAQSRADAEAVAQQRPSIRDLQPAGLQIAVCIHIDAPENMGQPQSRLTSEAITDIAAETIMNVGQDCMTVAQGDQIMYVGGSGNIFENNQQTMALSLDAACWQKAQQSVDMATKVQNEISQKLSETTQAMMQWADTSSRDVHSVIQTKLRNSVTANTIQNCAASITGKQIMAVQGQGNVFRKNVQDQTINIVKQCVQGSETTNRMTTDVSNTVNQHATYEAKSPLSFITDAITGSMKSIMAVAAVIFIVVICFAFLYMMMKGKDGMAGDFGALKSLASKK